MPGYIPNGPLHGSLHIHQREGSLPGRIIRGPCPLDPVSNNPLHQMVLGLQRRDDIETSYIEGPRRPCDIVDIHRRHRSSDDIPGSYRKRGNGLSQRIYYCYYWFSLALLNYPLPSPLPPLSPPRGRDRLPRGPPFPGDRGAVWKFSSMPLSFSNG